jgi:Family of unknown function (DUF5681)
MRFEKGRSGNPGGRPKGDGEIRELARQHTITALQTLAEICQNGENESARVAAANALLDRAWGKPAIPMGSSDLPTKITFNIAGPPAPPACRDRPFSIRGFRSAVERDLLFTGQDSLQQLKVPRDNGQQVIEVVGNATGQLPDRFELLRVPQHARRGGGADPGAIACAGGPTHGSRHRPSAAHLGCRSAPSQTAFSPPVSRLISGGMIHDLLIAIKNKSETQHGASRS